MHYKEIKAQIRKQLKSKYPNWKSLSRKEKRTLSRAILEQVSENYDFRNEITTPCHELLGIEEQQVSSDIMNLEQMGMFIESRYGGQLFNHFKSNGNSSYIKDEELTLINLKC